MAALTAPQRAAAVALFHQQYPPGESCSFVKADVAAAFAALDDYFVTNATSINTTLPTAFRTTANTVQKARLLNAVISARYLNGA